MCEGRPAILTILRILYSVYYLISISNTLYFLVKFISILYTFGVILSMLYILIDFSHIYIEKIVYFESVFF